MIFDIYVCIYIYIYIYTHTWYILSCSPEILYRFKLLQDIITLSIEVKCLFRSAFYLPEEENLLLGFCGIIHNSYAIDYYCVSLTYT